MSPARAARSASSPSDATDVVAGSWRGLVAVRVARALASLALGAGAVAVAGLWRLYDLAPRGSGAWLSAGFLALGAAGALASLLIPAARDREGLRRRAEARLGLKPGALEALDDEPAAGDGALWTLHRARIAEAARRPAATAFFDLSEADPFALRYALVVAAALAMWAFGDADPGRAGDGFRALGDWSGVASAPASVQGGDIGKAAKRAS